MLRMMSGGRSSSFNPFDGMLGSMRGTQFIPPTPSFALEPITLKLHSQF